MCIQWNLLGEFGRYRIAMRKHMADMARGEPEADDQGDNEKADE
jgi:hypothetical protein